MKLLGSTRSPFVCKARIVAMEKGLDCEFVEVSPRDPAVASANPLSKVPTLVRDDGRGLYDSVVIVEYLDALTEEPRLVPKDFDGRIEVKRWEALADGMMDTIAALSHEDREPEERRKGPEFYDRQQQKIDAGLARMDADLGQREYCHGDSLSLADLAVGCALLYADRIRPSLGWREKHPGLAQFMQRLSQRDSFKEL